MKRYCEECNYELDDGYKDSETLCGACVNVAESVTMLFKEHLGTVCPVCGDTMTEHSNYSPTWSDHYDNIVCWDCSGAVVVVGSCDCCEVTK